MCAARRFFIIIIVCNRPVVRSNQSIKEMPLKVENVLFLVHCRMISEQTVFSLVLSITNRLPLSVPLQVTPILCGIQSE